MKTTAATERVDLRIPAPLKERVRKIAALTGRSMSDFIIAAVIEKADEAAASIERWTLTEDDSRLVMELLVRERHGNLPELRELLALTGPDAARD
jgi:uncharacterized protein (DUF1778 family)